CSLVPSTTLFRSLVEGVKDKGGCEFMSEFGEVFPVQIFLKMFGLPLDHTAEFVAWENKLIHSMTFDGRREGATSIVAYLREVIGERRRAPSDDLISYVVGAQVDGRSLTDDEALGVCFLLYSAGLDTVANMLGMMFKHLA